MVWLVLSVGLPTSLFGTGKITLIAVNKRTEHRTHTDDDERQRHARFHGRF